MSLTDGMQPVIGKFILSPALVIAVAVLLTIAIPGLAFAHEGEGMAGGFLAGLQHPLFGPDHLIAMVAVGMWGAFLGSPAIWMLPIVFPIVMALGGALGVLGVPMIQVETGIALSGVVLGLAVALALRPPLWICAVIVGLFAIFHGHAHGTELPGAANPFAYSAGFVISTGALHLLGIAIGALTASEIGKIAVRTAGAAIAMGGLYFLLA